MRQIQLIDYPVIGEEGQVKGLLFLNVEDWVFAHLMLKDLAEFVGYRWVKQPDWLSGGYFVSPDGSKTMRIV